MKLTIDISTKMYHRACEIANNSTQNDFRTFLCKSIQNGQKILTEQESIQEMTDESKEIDI